MTEVPQIWKVLSIWSRQDELRFANYLLMLSSTLSTWNGEGLVINELYAEQVPYYAHKLCKENGV